MISFEAMGNVQVVNYKTRWRDNEIFGCIKCLNFHDRVTASYLRNLLVPCSELKDVNIHQTSQKLHVCVCARARVCVCVCVCVIINYSYKGRVLGDHDGGRPTFRWNSHE
jgi:hypothetical protein